MSKKGDVLRLTPTGRFSPLRYPGGKGKITKFVKAIITENNLNDGLYVEPYAGGAAVAWELLLTGIVRRVAINDISLPIYSFWKSVLEETDIFCKLIQDTPITVQEWKKNKLIYSGKFEVSRLELGFSFFFLNRTNRSGILNAGMIGGNNQQGKWKIDARFNKANLIQRIEKIAAYGDRIEVTNLDAVKLLEDKSRFWNEKTLIYLDPPYYEKGRLLYHDAYAPDDHKDIAKQVAKLDKPKWIVSYDDVRPIHDLYGTATWLQYNLRYSATNATKGREAMFFSEGLKVPKVESPLVELDRGNSNNNDNFRLPHNRKFI